MIVDLDAIALAVEEGVRRGRDNPEMSVDLLVHEAMSRLGDDAGRGSVETDNLARKWLDAAASSAEEMGEIPDSPRNFALIGIGYALLAANANAEVFYAMFASGEARVDVKTTRMD